MPAGEPWIDWDTRADEKRKAQILRCNGVTKKLFAGGCVTVVCVILLLEYRVLQSYGYIGK